MKIVVADDEPDMREYFLRMLTHLGHEVLAIAKDGEELVRICQLESPDLIITDLNMPVMNGDKAIELIWDKMKIPVVIVSAFQCPEDLLLNTPHPPLRYLNKPINRIQLKEVLDSI
ncbi:response regulator [Rubinisphaera italica]|uniref:Putative transcriptional regulatory protein pdtaR n=1 Tax=Rubinisphaera italica TaxID=2527969 RepID=A0A5C5XC82_9PLAN|nr:response regulator [Rubinisphaera italica]TWT60051.1 putative transcriptional regulatory protein pdtaR [Rubinisphaera italica]